MSGADHTHCTYGPESRIVLLASETVPAAPVYLTDEEAFELADMLTRGKLKCLLKLIDEWSMLQWGGVEDRHTRSFHASMTAHLILNERRRFTWRP